MAYLPLIYLRRFSFKIHPENVQLSKFQKKKKQTGDDEVAVAKEPTNCQLPWCISHILLVGFAPHSHKIPTKAAKK